MYFYTYKINNNEQNILLEMRNCACGYNGNDTRNKVLVNSHNLLGKPWI